MIRFNEEKRLEFEFNIPIWPKWWIHCSWLDDTFRLGLLEQK